MAGARHAMIEAAIVAVPETAGSALYGMVDVLAATGNLWEELVGLPSQEQRIRPRIVSVTTDPFRCRNAIPIAPELAIGDTFSPDIVILPELWLGTDEPLAGRYPNLTHWILEQYRRGASIYSACSGAIMLAETGLLDGREATSHWGYQDLFRRHYPKVRFRPEPNLVFADHAGRIVTAGGTTSWHDLAIHIIARHCSPGDALRIAKAYLLKWHGEGQLPYASLVRRHHHADAVVRACETWLARHFREANVLGRAVAASGVPERTLKRRFKVATGLALIEYVQNLRIEEAKRLLETSDQAVDDISAEVGYEEPAFFRRLFKRTSGLTPGEYRRLFKAVAMGGPAMEAADS